MTGSSEAHRDPTHIDRRRFRDVMGQYPTGVVVVTSISESGSALAMTVGSFTSVSLDPPLIAFLPQRASKTWAAFGETSHGFCVSVLGHHQEGVSRLVAMRDADKLADIDWFPSPLGNPVLSGAIAYVDCNVEQVHEAGDHYIVVGRVVALDVLSTSDPLLFFQGGYGSFAPMSLAVREVDLISQLELIDNIRDQLDDLAAALGTQVTVTVRLGDQLVQAVSAGRVADAVRPNRVGSRVRFMPPVGGAFAAWGAEEVRARWIANLGVSLPTELADELLAIPHRMRERGYGISFGHEVSVQLERLFMKSARDPIAVSPAEVRSAVASVAGSYTPERIEGEDFELRSVTAPVFDASGAVAFTLTAWGPAARISRERVDQFIFSLMATAESAATATVGQPSDR
jgi:flavin reductase (DIM6/NTAB) family NADH-FMN oxidoreductase RutF/DNA-binding IclR family transcriptional regulator